MVSSEPLTRTPDPKMLASLRSIGLLTDGDGAGFEALTGGVSSDIWKINTASRTFCVKQALPKLKVEADWYAPVERNAFEVAWYSTANSIVPGAAPQILAHDSTNMLFAMDFLDPGTHKLWKSELRDGNVRIEDAREAGRRLGKIHATSAGDAEVAKKFPRKDIFHAIRLEPYLEATALRHPDLKDRLFGLSERTAQTQLCMIHGDVSPKNILIGPHGPVFLDAECACIGDPAFDLAFCLNHFLLKCLWTPASTDAFLESFSAMLSAYLTEVTWETQNSLEARTASLLPGLLLARVDGKSPVEYITQESDKDLVRRCARALLIDPPETLKAIGDAWQKELKNDYKN